MAISSKSNIRTHGFFDFRHLIALIGILLFASLGFKWINTYSLWDDEANTALFAGSVHSTGDTSAVIGHNIVAFRNGAELNSSKKARYVSPFQYYFLAPFIDPAHPDPMKARLPFLVLTLFSLALIYWRIIKQKLPTPIVFAFFCLSFGLTSFLLFGIQARYYALTFFFALLLSDQYFFGKLQTTRQFFRFGLVGSFLFISNYLIGVAALVSLFTHYLFIRRGSIRNIWALLVPHVILSMPVFLIWNPLGKTVVEMKNTPFDKLNLLFRNVRDFNGGHLGSLVLLLLGIFLFQKESKKRFKAYGVIFIVYLITISLFSPQPVRGTGLADIRYLYPLMLLSFAWSLDFFSLLLQKNKALFASGVFVFSFFSFPYSGELRFQFSDLVLELNTPADDPYRLVTNELIKLPITQTTHPTLLSSVDYATYPLMFHAPQFQYTQTENIIPDYLVNFCDDTLKYSLEQRYSIKYEQVASIPSVCREAFRPEVFLRSFARDQKRGEIHIFKKI